MEDHRARRHLPGRVPIDAYGRGGFRFPAGLSHQGSILCLPSGVYAWDVTEFDILDTASLAPVLAERADGIETLLIGTGERLRPCPPALRAHLRGAGIGVDCLDTGAACRTYNVMMAENRAVAAALIAVG